MASVEGAQALAASVAALVRKFRTDGADPDDIVPALLVVAAQVAMSAHVDDSDELLDKMATVLAATIHDEKARRRPTRQ